jgi:hypothetical protein
MSPLLLLLILLLPLAIFLADGNWRDSLIYSVVIGFLQDPLRKITPDQPSLYVGLVLIGVVLTALLLYSRTGRLSLEPLFSGDRQLIGVVEIFIALLLLQILNSFLNLGSLTLTMVGAGFYFAPLIALWLGYQFALQPASVRRFVNTYLFMAFAFAFTVFLSFRGLNSDLFKEVGSGLLINFTELGTMQQGYVGLWRSSEIAAWHIATACCFLLILAVSSRRPNLISLAGLVVVALLVLSSVTGRRKVLTLVTSFVGFYSLMIALRGDSRIRGNVLAGFGGVGLMLSLLISFGANPADSGTLGGFVRRTASVWENVDERLQTVGFSTIGAALEAAGPFGFGVGAAAQGAASLGIRVNQATWAAEGGFGKISAELGLAGIAIFAMIIVLLSLLYWRIIGQLRFAPPSYSLLNLGLLSFLAANLPNFAVASQAYGDPFILCLLGLSAGFVLASPTVLSAHLQAQQPPPPPTNGNGLPPGSPQSTHPQGRP